jgi:hypothetical protein
MLTENLSYKKNKFKTMKKKVFIYVGHSNWGKSMALKVLTGGSSRKKIANISSHIVRVRKMSNDDNGQGLLDWVIDIPRINYQRFIIAFCPKSPPVSGEATTEQDIGLDILIELQKTNELFFFIQKEKFNNPTQQISQDEINWISNYGIVQILSGQNSNQIRATEFESFIKVHI